MHKQIFNKQLANHFINLCSIFNCSTDIQPEWIARITDCTSLVLTYCSVQGVVLVDSVFDPPPEPEVRGLGWTTVAVGGAQPGRAGRWGTSESGIQHLPLRRGFRAPEMRYGSRVLSTRRRSSLLIQCASMTA